VEVTGDHDKIHFDRVTENETLITVAQENMEKRELLLRYKI
jgi:hypothetical protein